MPQFRFTILLTRKDGSSEEAGTLELEHENYNGHNEQTALAHLLAHKEQYGFDTDQEMGLVMCGGVMIPLADFARLGLRLDQKSKD